MNDPASSPLPKPVADASLDGLDRSVLLVVGIVVLDAIMSIFDTPGADTGSATGPEMSDTIAAD